VIRMAAEYLTHLGVARRHKADPIDSPDT